GRGGEGERALSPSLRMERNRGTSATKPTKLNEGWGNARNNKNAEAIGKKNGPSDRDLKAG
ncbi:MAG: hypothetical protein J7M27_06355, partial [Candidatus Latescibacteria bacterium]|nr:hypothetical protein [Candidatus Latescibacterota bacterium]